MYKSVPTTLQMQAADCGAASLKMLLDSNSIYYTLEEIRLVIGIGRDGSTIGDIRRAAESLEFPLVAERIDQAQLQQQAPPFILWWNSNHFVVYEGQKRSKYFINDPALGRRELNPDDFFQGFTGVIIYPSPEVQKNAIPIASPNIVRPRSILFDLFSDYIFNIALVLGLSLACIIPSIAVSQLTSYYIDSVIGQDNTLVAIPLLWLLLLFAGLIALLNYLSFSIAGSTVFAASTRKSVELLRSIASRNFAWFSNRQIAELSTRFSIPSRQINTAVYDLISDLSCILSGLIISLLLLASCFPLGVFTVLVITANFAVAFFINRSIENENRLVSIEAGKQQGLSLMTLGELLLVRTSGLESQRFSTWAGYYTNYVNAQYSVSSGLNIIGLASRSAFYILNVGLIIIGPILIMSHKLSLGGFISTSYLMGIVTTSVISIPSLLSNVQTIVSPLDRTKDILEAGSDYDIPLVFNHVGKHESETPTHLAVDSLTFSFTPDNRPIDDLSLEVPISGIINITGAAGSGKSVLLKLLSNLYLPTKGSISWLVKSESAEIQHSIDPNSLRALYIPQKPTIIDGSLLDNIAFGDPSIPHNHLVSAAKQAGLLSSDLIASGMSIQRHLRFGGSTISNSVAQRIFLARALSSSSATILFLDFCFGDLDVDSVSEIFHLLRLKYKAIFFAAPTSYLASISDYTITL